MAPESGLWKRIEALFHAALEKPSGERSIFLDEACGDDADLRGEVESLLVQSVDGFMTVGNPFAPGARVGRYEILALLGRGGMGEVWRARDTTLGRDVAIKALPAGLSRDPERLARFEREARILASLNHPNIGTIFQLEEHAHTPFLVLELIEGPTLADRLSAPIPGGEALGYALQIVGALEAAHERNIVHRDLKPSNVKITPEDRVKVLDFGLAKLGTDRLVGVDGTDPAIPENELARYAPATREGVILGTVAYMAPEQAQGRRIDRRADIFAFGCILYEMLTGRPAFEGESSAAILSKIIERDPDWTRVPAAVPASIHRLMRLCLEKDPKRRRQAAGDVRIDIEQALAEPPPVPRGRPRSHARFVWIASMVVLTLTLAIPAAIHLFEQPPSELRLQILTPPTREPLHFALSPDGRSVVFVASRPADETARLYLQPLDTTDAQPLAGTEGAQHPFWSPDSRSIGFFASGTLFRLDLTGGPPQALAPARFPQGAAWGRDGTILFAPHTVSPLLRVPAAGGEPVALTRLDPPRQWGHRLPSFLPDGRHFLFYVEGEPEVSGTYLGSLDGEAPTRLMEADSAGAYLPPDHIVFVRQGALVARPLDIARREWTGDPVTLADSVGSDSWSLGGFSASPAGMLAYRTANPSRGEAIWFDRTGRELGRFEDILNGPEVSPDGRRVAFDRIRAGNRDAWVMDLVRGGLTRFTDHPAVDGYPVWSPDGSQIVFTSTRNGTFDLWIRPSSRTGPAELLLETPDSGGPLQWSADGGFVLYQRSEDLGTAFDLWALPMTGSDRTPIPVANTNFAERMGQISPDGRWVAYETNESGRPEIVAQTFPEPGGRQLVSTDGGTAPRWSADGKEIYFVALDGTMMAVPVATTDSTFEPGTPAPLFPTRILPQAFKFQYAVAPDGRFLVNHEGMDAGSVSPITVVLNWKP